MSCAGVCALRIQWILSMHARQGNHLTLECLSVMPSPGWQQQSCVLKPCIHYVVVLQLVAASSRAVCWWSQSACTGCVAQFSVAHLWFFTMLSEPTQQLCQRIYLVA